MSAEITVTGRQGRERIVLKSNGEVSLHRWLDRESKWDWIANSDIPLNEEELTAWLSGWDDQDVNVARAVLTLQPQDLLRQAA